MGAGMEGEVASDGWPWLGLGIELGRHMHAVLLGLLGVGVLWDNVWVGGMGSVGLDFEIVPGRAERFRNLGVVAGGIHRL